MSAHYRQYKDAEDHLFEAAAIMRLNSLAVDHLRFQNCTKPDDIMAAIGRGADAAERLTQIALILLEDLSVELKGAA